MSAACVVRNVTFRAHNGRYLSRLSCARSNCELCSCKTVTRSFSTRSDRCVSRFCRQFLSHARVRLKLGTHCPCPRPVNTVSFFWFPMYSSTHSTSGNTVPKPKQISNTNPNHSPKTKDLGVTFDYRLTFREHIHQKVNKAYSILGLIKEILYI